jgi:fucose permease
MAIPASGRFSANGQLQVLIYNCILSVASSLLLIGLGFGRLAVYLGSAWFGLAMSAIYPLLMSLPNSLKFRMTAQNTSRFVVSGAVGESIIPILFGVIMGILGPNMLFIIALIISFLFLGLHKKALEYSYLAGPKTDIEMELFFRA